MRVIACNSPYGRGGVGQRFAQLIEVSGEHGTLDRYYAPGPTDADEKRIHPDTARWQDWVLQYTPICFNPAWRSYLDSKFFDRAVAKQLSFPMKRFMGCVGTSLRSFRQAMRSERSI